MGSSACGGRDQCRPDVYWRHCQRLWLPNYDVRHTRPDCGGHFWRRSLFFKHVGLGLVRRISRKCTCYWRRRWCCPKHNNHRHGRVNGAWGQCRNGGFTAANNAIYSTSGSALTAGTLPIAAGGTNSTATATAGGAGYGTGTAHAYTAAGTAGQILTSAGASAPAWGSLDGGTF